MIGAGAYELLIVRIIATNLVMMGSAIELHVANVEDFRISQSREMMS